MPGCTVKGEKCGRIVRDDFISTKVVQQLREIAEIGMANRSTLGGPTIMDANSGTKSPKMVASSFNVFVQDTLKMEMAW